MKRIYQLAFVAVVALLMFSSCQEESDIVLERIASPVLLEIDTAGLDNTIAIFYELDKSGIMDHTVGIDSITISGLSIEVSSAGILLGTFTTDSEGAISIPTDEGATYAGEYKGIRFRFQ